MRLWAVTLWNCSMVLEINSPFGTFLKLSCFRWYLEHVYPESQMPLDYFFLGEMRNDASHNCLDTMGRKSGEEVCPTFSIFSWVSKKLFSRVISIGGYELLPRAWWKSSICLHQATAGCSSILRKSFMFLHQVMSDDNCLDAAGAEGPVKLVRCHGMGGNQAWVYNKMDK